ncbi:MAG: M23 family metallopeptidase [Hyphomonas sp.]|nr:M23 family metallopeptidase [Hyphomonas sp.]
MSGTEKFLFLGTVTLAILVMSHPDIDLSLTGDRTLSGVLNTPPAADETDAAPETDTTPVTAEPEPAPAPDPEPPALLTISTPADGPGHLAALSACKGLSTASAPNVDAELHVTDYRPFVLARGKVRLATAPIAEGCYSSAFGMRDGKLHKGVDYYNETAVPVYAAADGTIRTRTYRNDYGNMLVIDHGDGVFTRYAHLEEFAAADVGDEVSAGQQVGLMGHTAGYAVPRHLHYEVLTGTWQAQAGSFALAPVDPMGLPAAE